MEKSWETFNGCSEGNKKEKFTFTGGRESTATDYVLENEEAKEEEERLQIGDGLRSPPIKGIEGR